MARLVVSLALSLALAACAQAPLPAVAAAASGDTPSTTTDAAFTLTMGAVDRFFAAQPALADAVEADPDLDPAIDVSGEDITAYVARLEATPALRDALGRVGLSAREYALTSAHLMDALMAQSALDSGLIQALPEGVSRRNVEFVRAHRGQIEARAMAAGD